MGPANNYNHNYVNSNDAGPQRADPGNPQRPPPSTETTEADEVGRKSDSVREKQLDEEEDADGTGSPRTRFILDPAGELTHDETNVDVVTVPCPGGHPLRSWSRDGLMGRYFGAPSMRDAEMNAAESPGPSWVRQGIRREADRARILLYAHPEAVEGTTLNALATSLLEELRTLRLREGQQRPLVFIGHSVGGLVVKMALVKASRDARYEGIVSECYGVAFFGTPHQGSTYFAMPSLASSIRSLLQLSAPLPPSLAYDLRMGNSLLLHVDEDFKTISDDLHVWTFYETIDSRLSGSSSGDVYFTAPLASIKSAILGMRQERIFPLQSDHANIASFGRHNAHTQRLFLRQLAAEIARADENTSAGAKSGKWALDLEQKVSVEVHGFFDEAASGAADGTVRAWSTRLPLREFLSKGPEACLSERLNEVEGPPEERRSPGMRRRTAVAEVDAEMDAEMDGPPGILPGIRPAVPFPPHPMAIKDALGINHNDLKPQDQQRQHQQQMAPISRSSSPGLPSGAAATYARPERQMESAPAMFSRPLGGGSLTPASGPISPAARHSRTPIRTPIRRPSPVVRSDIDQDLAIDRLSPPIQGRVRRSISRSMSLGCEAGGVSPPRFRDFSPFSQRSRSALDGALSGENSDEDGGDDNDADDNDHGLEALLQLPEPVVAIRNIVKDGEHGTSGTAVMDELVQVAFAKPEVKARKFVWIHVPFNNPTWVSSILRTLQVCYQRNFSALSNHDFWMTRHTRGRHSQHYAYYAKPGCYFTPPHALSPRSHPATSLTLSPTLGDGAMYTCLFLPYLHFDSYKRLIRRRELISQRLAHGRARPIPESIAKSDSLELQVIWEFLGHDPPINCRRTLDQFRYPSLRDTRSRDDDQMLYKLTKQRECAVNENKWLRSQTSSTAFGSDGGRSGNGSGTGSWREKKATADGNSDDETPEKEVLNGNVLMVDQLWIWALSSHTLLSFFPKRESDPIEGPLFQQADLRDSIFNDVNADLTRQCENALDLAALAALHAVSVLLDRSSHPTLEVFRIFEEAISVLTEKLTFSLKEFRSEGFRDKAFDYEPVEDKARSIRARHKEEGRRAEQENRDNTSALLELRDIEDELQILLHLFERQSKVLSSMHAIYSSPEIRDQTIHGRVFLGEAHKRLDEYTQQADEMIRRVRSTRDDYDKLLQMVQRQAQVDEVRLSRLHADLASAQSRSVLIFTTFTVIFLPLQFFTGIFGMNTREWGGGDNLSLRTIGVVALPASVFMIIATLIIAWSTNVRRGFRWLGRQYGWAMRWLYRAVCRPLTRTALRRVARKKKRRQGQRRGDDREAARSRLNKETSDFWERHKAERERGYQIPEVNKAAGARTAQRQLGSKVKKEGRGGK